MGETPEPMTGRELQAIVRAERDGVPFFVYRDSGGQQRIVRFDSERNELTVGRNAAADLRFGWDEEVSGLHAQLEHLAGELTLVDDGLSLNGSYVNGERVHGRRRLHDGDSVRFGRSVVLVRKPTDADRRLTSAAQRWLAAPELTAQQRNVLIALCRPLKESEAIATPATNRQIADELYLSVSAVKVHLRALFDKFQVADLPQNTKRVALAGRALQSGLLTDRELARTPAPPEGR